MSFDISIVASGLNVSQVLSDENHFGSFLCGCCSKLVSLDSVVTDGCNHPFCRRCLEQTAMEAFVSQSECTCPTCKTSINNNHGESTPCMQVGSLQIAARPVAQAQPLAYKVLGMIQVACVDGQCQWRGDYSDYLKHVMSHNSGQPSNATCSTSVPPNSTAKKVVPPKQNESDNQNDRNDEVRKSKSCARNSDRSLSSNKRKPSKAQQNDWNSSISSNMGFWDCDVLDHTDTSMRDSSLDGESPLGGSAADDSSSHFDDSMLDLERQNELDGHKRVLDKAEKFKKQANAKFNKNEFSAARNLYSKGIEILSGVDLEVDSERDLLANMHSNRAVACFRNKQFDECIRDSEMAIQHQPTLEKSWVRKWRALKAKGEFDEAYAFIGKASQNLPESEKLQQYYRSCKKEKDLLKKVQAFMAEGDVVNAKATLDPAVGSDCDNIVLFVYSARLSITVGALEEALEKINKALRFNPDYVDALESRGFLYFFQGEMEKASTFLYDAHVRHKDHSNIELAMKRVRKTKTLYEQANDMVEREMYKESVEAFTAAIDASSPMPPLAPFYAILRTHRAESYMSTKQFLPALQDCQEVLKFQTKFAPAWVVRAKVMCALGKAEHARKELIAARRTWGAGDPHIEKGCKFVEFELRVSREDQSMESFQKELDAGDRSRIMTRMGAVPQLASRRGSDSQIKQVEGPSALQRDNSMSRNALVAQKSDKNIAPTSRRVKTSNFCKSMSDLGDISASDLFEEPRRRKKIADGQSSRNLGGGKDGERRRRRPSVTSDKSGTTNQSDDEKADRRERRRSGAERKSSRS